MPSLLRGNTSGRKWLLLLDQNLIRCLKAGERGPATMNLAVHDLSDFLPEFFWRFQLGHVPGIEQQVAGHICNFPVAGLGRWIFDIFE